MASEATMTLNLTAREMAVLEEIAEHHGMSKTGVMRQALRLYQLTFIRLKDGERMSWSGDSARVAEFVGIGLSPLDFPERKDHPNV
jgi:hypothetical protein